MNKFLVTTMTILGMAAVALGGTVRDNQNFTGEVNIDTGGKFKLKGTELTATAAELNQLAGDAGLDPSVLTLTEGQMVFGDGGTGTAAVVSGDVLIPKTGVAAIQPLAVDDGDIALVNTYIIVGDNGTGTAVVVSGDASLANDGALSVTQLNAIAVATVTGGAALGDTALQPITQVSGVSTVALVATVTFQSSIAGVQHLTGWASESAGGVAVGTNYTSIVGADSTTVLAGGGDTIAYAVWSSKSDGLSTLTITTKAAQNGLYFNTVQSDGVVVSTPAYDVAP